MDREKLERHRKATYAAVRNADELLYRRAVEIGHLATIDFGGQDELRRSATVEAAVMALLAQALSLDITTTNG